MCICHTTSWVIHYSSQKFAVVDPVSWNCLPFKIESELISLLPYFFPDISIAPLQFHYYSEALPATALILCWS